MNLHTITHIYHKIYVYRKGHNNVNIIYQKIKILTFISYSSKSDMGSRYKSYCKALPFINIVNKMIENDFLY